MKDSNSQSHCTQHCLPMLAGGRECFRFLGAYICADLTWSTLTHRTRPGTKFSKVLPQEVVLQANQANPRFPHSEAFLGQPTA